MSEFAVHGPSKRDDDIQGGADDLRHWSGGRWAASWGNAWGASSWGGTEYGWSRDSWSSPAAWEGRWSSASWWSALQPATAPAKECRGWSGASAYWWSTADSGSGSGARWADGHSDLASNVKTASPTAVDTAEQRTSAKVVPAGVASQTLPNSAPTRSAPMPQSIAPQEGAPKEHHSAEILERGVRLTLECNGQEAPAWMLNGPEYKIIDMDTGDGWSTPDTVITKRRVASPPIHQVVADLEAIAASTGKNSGRSAKDVTLDAKTRRCCSGLDATLEEQPEVDRTLLSLLVRASIALAKIRILHRSVFECLGRADPARLRAVDASRIVDAMWAFATMGVLYHPATEHWAAALGFGAMRQLSTLQLANLSWAAAVLEVERMQPDLPKAIAEYVMTLDLQSIAWSHLARIAWGLARMMPSPNDLPAWAVRVKGAVESGKPRTGPILGEAMWALAHWGEGDAMQRVVSRLPDESWGRDAYGVMLRTNKADCIASARILQQMASHLSVPGLKAAVLNSALLRLIRGSHWKEAELLLQDLASQGLWTPVTYYAQHLLTSGWGSRVTGRPPAPGRVDPGQSAHKYTKAVYHVLEHAERGDAAAVMAHLESFSKEKGWLKFGAEGEKGSVIDGVVRELRRDAVVVELGTFLGYSAIRIARQLGPCCRIITVEFDAEVACLAETLLIHAGMENRVEVWIGNTEDLVPELRTALGRHPADLVYMDHNQGIFHEDVQRMEAAGIISFGTAVVATQVLKPGAPLLAWHLAEQQRLGRCELELVSSPDCGCPMMEDWVAVARYQTDPTAEDVEPGCPPAALHHLARVCNLMRWRTAQGLVDEKKWNCFVQHVRAGMEASSLMSTRHVWEPSLLSKARQFRYIPFDF